MNETSSHVSVTEAAFCGTPKDMNISPKITALKPSDIAQECRDDTSFAFSPIPMDLSATLAKNSGNEKSDSNTNERDAGVINELNTSFPSQNDIQISSPSHSDNVEEKDDDEETEDQQLQRESESLARQLMAEEALASYQASSDFLRENADQFSEEDLAALQAIMAEEDPEIEDDYPEEGEGEGEMSYDALLRLGEQIGNVKEERWALVARENIDSIPVVKFTKDMAEGKDENHTEVKCLVCQFTYEEGDELRRLRCDHCFHKECIDEWLGNKDTCAFCLKSIVD